MAHKKQGWLTELLESLILGPVIIGTGLFVAFWVILYEVLPEGTHALMVHRLQGCESPYGSVERACRLTRRLPAKRPFLVCVTDAKVVVYRLHEALLPLKDNAVRSADVQRRVAAIIDGLPGSGAARPGRARRARTD